MVQKCQNGNKITMKYILKWCHAHSLNSQKIESNGLYYINNKNIICMNFYLDDNYALIYLLSVIDFKDI